MFFWKKRTLLKVFSPFEHIWVHQVKILWFTVRFISLQTSDREIFLKMFQSFRENSSSTKSRFRSLLGRPGASGKSRTTRCQNSSLLRLGVSQNVEKRIWKKFELFWSTVGLMFVKIWTCLVKHWICFVKSWTCFIKTSISLFTIWTFLVKQYTFLVKCLICLINIWTSLVNISTCLVKIWTFVITK